MTKSIEFYFDFSSPYSYIGYKEIKKLEKKKEFQVWHLQVCIFLVVENNSLKQLKR